MKIRNGWGWVRGFGFANGTPERSILEPIDYKALYEDATERLAQVEEALNDAPTYEGAVTAAYDVLYQDQV
ncbi:hypothetical protein [Streptomyces sp. NPDC006879]|uniref:hypothetical protein n=1 Tax=Streptomyces sp. NPDC006879 TaxID=3364767 RepID=UPI003689848C